MQIAQGFLNLRPLTAYRNWQAFGLLSLGVGLSLLVSLIPLQWGVMILLACVVVSENSVFLLKFSKFRTKRHDPDAESELSPES